ncbi:hypothetical protein [Undibacterium rugosum]|uniref:hypothetical protein n=1 Tax=Undibacterium rugosum TaxID=2762291 RepID=UPI001B8171BA|nr:hypothetical protein [Undibacterium rugosum]MBR7779074.1 hypothetical protein [Undibacterium rugosum]
MTAYKKFLLTWLVIMVIGFLIIFSFLYVSDQFVLPFLLFIFISQIFLSKIICPNCGAPVTYQGKIAGTRIYGGFLHRKCRACEWDLNKDLSGDR